MAEISFTMHDDFWADEEKEMAEAGYSLDKISREHHEQHIWSCGFLLFWRQNHRLPTARELQSEMFYEWDDPVGLDEARKVLEEIGLDNQPRV